MRRARPPMAFKTCRSWCFLWFMGLSVVDSVDNVCVGFFSLSFPVGLMVFVCLVFCSNVCFFLENTVDVKCVLSFVLIPTTSCHPRIDSNQEI